jgi:hypothetical protein
MIPRGKGEVSIEMYNGMVFDVKEKVLAVE